MMMASGEFQTYCSGVPSTGLNWGVPSMVGLYAGPPLRGTSAVCGTELAITASLACGVPATAVSTGAAWLLDGICRNSAGRSLLLTKVQGPESFGRVEPASRDQDIVVVVVRIHDDVGAGIGDPEQIRAGDRLEPGLALEDDQLRRGGRDEELGRRAPQRRLRLTLAAPFEADRPGPSWRARRRSG